MEVTAVAERFLIVGAGDFGIELACWLRSAATVDATLGGFLDDNLDAHSPLPGVEVLGTVLGYVPLAGDTLLMGLSDPAVKSLVSNQLVKRGAEFGTFIHPSAIISEGVTIGKGCVICPNVIVSYGAVLQDFVTVNVSATVGHHTNIGSFSSLMSHCDIMGWASLAEQVTIGSRAGVLPRVKVGPRATIGAGSTAFSHVRPGVTAIGVPAKRFFTEKTE
jgi:sugar O-acyltransferase (sialic acid O-acetyltransferase NeuD family)